MKIQVSILFGSILYTFSSSIFASANDEHRAKVGIHNHVDFKQSSTISDVEKTKSGSKNHVDRRELVDVIGNAEINKVATKEKPTKATMPVSTNRLRSSSSSSTNLKRTNVEPFYHQTPKTSEEVISLNRHQSNKANNDGTGQPGGTEEYMTPSSIASKSNALQASNRDCRMLTLTFVTDGWPEENSISLGNAQGIIWGEFMFAQYTQYDYVACLDMNGCTTLDVTDTYGDGLSDYGYLQLALDGYILFDSWDIGYGFVWQFGNTCPY